MKPSSEYRLTFFHTFSTEPHVVSTRVHPRSTSDVNSSTVMPNAGRMTTASGTQDVEGFAGIAQKPDAQRADLIVDVRVVDDLAGQVDGSIGEAASRLVRVVNGAIDSVTEAKLPRQIQAEAARLEAVVRSP